MRVSLVVGSQWVGQPPCPAAELEALCAGQGSGDAAAMPAGACDDADGGAWLDLALSPVAPAHPLAAAAVTAPAARVLPAG